MVINGAMNVAQRGTSSTSENFQTVDRFRFSTNTMDELAFTQSQDTDGPEGFANSYKVTVDTPESSLILKEWLYMRYTMEGQDAQIFQFGTSAAKKTTMSFWVKSSIVGDYAVLFFNDQGSVRGQTLTYTINTANTWEYKTIVFDGDTTQNFSNSSAAGPDFYFTLSAGPDRKTTNGSSWINYTATASAYGQTADVATVNGATWQITGVCLNVGDSAIDFPHESYGETLAKCQRYYQQYDYTDQYANVFTPTFNINSTQVRGTFQFAVEMRAAPTYTTNGAGNFRINNNTSDEVCAAVGSQGTTTHGTTLTFDKTTSNLSNGGISYVNTENTNDASLRFDAEL
jgi:hypothetical protein